MPVEILTRRHVFTYKQIWLTDQPYDVSGCATVRFLNCKKRVEMPGFRRDDFATLTIDLREELDTIWRNMGL